MVRPRRFSAPSCTRPTRPRCTRKALHLASGVSRPLAAPSCAYYRISLPNRNALFTVSFLYRLTAFYLTVLNRSHATRRTTMGKTGVLVDASLETTKDAAAAQQANGTDFAANAFDDLTDKANEDFICALRLGPVDDYADVSARRTLMTNAYFVCCIRCELSAQLRKRNTFNGTLRTFDCSSQPRYLQVSCFHMSSTVHRHSIFILPPYSKSSFRSHEKP
jgi:hypothetical protein